MNESKTPTTEVSSPKLVYGVAIVEFCSAGEKFVEQYESLELQLAEAKRETQELNECRKQHLALRVQAEQERDQLSARVVKLEKALKLAVEEYDAGGKCWHSFEVIGEMRATLHSL